MKKGFTLIEVTVAIAVFVTVMSAVGGIIITIQQGWQTQKNGIEIIENLRWASELMSAEIRAGGNLAVSSADRVSFEIDTDGDSSLDTKVWYWRGNTSSDSTGLGKNSYLYRGLGNNINQAYSQRQQLADFITNNTSGNGNFVFNSGFLTIELTTLNQKASFNLRTAVRPLNQ